MAKTTKTDKQSAPEHTTGYLQHIETTEPQAETMTLSNPSFIYDDTTVTVKPRLSIQEVYEFVERVVTESFIDGITPSKLHTDVAFVITLIDMYTDYELPTKELDGSLVFDSEASFEVARTMMQDVCELIGSVSIVELREYVDDRIQFEKDMRIAAASRSVATEDVLETVSELAYRGLELINQAIDQVDRNGDKLFKAITPKKIEKLVDGLIGKISGLNSSVPTDE